MTKFRYVSRFFTMVTSGLSEVAISGNVVCSTASIFAVACCFLENFCTAFMCEVEKV